MVLLVAKNKRILPYFVYFVHKSLSLFPFSQFILKNYGEDPDNYNEQLKKLEQLRQVSLTVHPRYTFINYVSSLKITLITILYHLGKQ